jgi:hypothetical protein
MMMSKPPKLRANVRALILLSFLLFSIDLSATTYLIGPGQSFSSLEQAADILIPGDTAIVQNGDYNLRENISNLQGSPYQPIVIMAETSRGVVYRGGTEAWHLSDCAHLKIIGFVFREQTGNGINIDDAGTFNTPTHHIIVEDCAFLDMNASGNNDQMKLSGLDHFQVRFCEFRNGSGGGSGIDMVGCHNGIIRGNTFENMGSNAIQAKGGTQHITIEQNRFKNCGFRSINLGGSTGLAFFRPQDAPFEAADLLVRANIFIGSDAPIAYVGCNRVDVVNNTIVEPEVWIFRILQETVDPNRFISCGDNSFRNNIVYVDDRLRRDYNIGSNTRPESFTFSDNMWYTHETPSWRGPDLSFAGVEPNSLIRTDPLFVNRANENFHLQRRSLAIGSGELQNETFFDFDGNRYGEPSTRGAYEGGINAEPPFAPIGAQWYFDEPWASRKYLGYYRLEVVGDTIIQRKTAQQIDFYQGSQSGENQIKEATLWVTSEGNEVLLWTGDDYDRLYLFEETHSPIEGASLVLDYHYYHVEEWLPRQKVLFSYPQMYDRTIQVSGKDLKVFEPGNVDGETDICISYGDQIIERIGSVSQGLMAHPCQTLRGGVYGQLRCYSDSDLFYNHQGTSCDTVAVSTNTTEDITDEIQIYPNPAMDIIHLRVSEISQYVLINGAGQQVESGKLLKGLNLIDISGLPRGSYFVRVKHGKGEKLEPFIKE